MGQVLVIDPDPHRATAIAKVVSGLGRRVLHLKSPAGIRDLGPDLILWAAEPGRPFEPSLASEGFDPENRPGVLLYSDSDRTPPLPEDSGLIIETISGTDPPTLVRARLANLLELIETQRARPLADRIFRESGSRLTFLPGPSLMDLAAACRCSEPVGIWGEPGSGKRLVAGLLHDFGPHPEVGLVIRDATSLQPDQGPEAELDDLFDLLSGRSPGEILYLTGAERLTGVQIRELLHLAAATDLDGHPPRKLILGLDPARPPGFEKTSPANIRDLKLLPLRSAPERIELMSLIRLVEFCGRESIPVKGISPEVADLFKRYPWPGNLRELEDVLQTSILNAVEAPVIYPAHLPHSVRSAGRLDPGPGPGRPGLGHDSPVGPVESLADFRARTERIYAETILHSVEGEVSEAARKAGVSRSTFYKLMAKYKLATK